MKDGRVTINLKNVIGRIDPKIYGQFIEHFHRCIYGGICDEGSGLSDEAGYRRDVAEALRRIRTPILRWPGGCYVDGYHWENGVGPKDERPTTYDLAWRVEESHRFGTDEFIEYCRLIGAEPYINVNVGSGTPEEAAQWVEYCNRRGKSYFAALRRECGHAEPYDVIYWGIGNEIGGWWEIGTLTAEEYAREVRRYVKLMQRVDPRIKIIGVGYERDPDWNRVLLENAGDVIDYISAHAYHYREVPDYYASVGSTIITEERLKNLTNTIHVAEYKLAKRLGRKKRIEIAFDEWNAWGWSHPSPNAVMTEEEFTRKFLENDENKLYALREGLFTAKYLHIFHRMCNSVTMAAFSPAVNVRGLIFTHEKGIVLRPYYHAFDLYVNHSGETVVDSKVESETFNSQYAFWGEQVSLKDVPYIDVSATLSYEKRKLFIAVINLHKDSDIVCKIVIEGGDFRGKAKIWELNGPNVESYNDVSHSNDVVVVQKPPIKVSKKFNYTFPAHSATTIEMELI